MLNQLLAIKCRREQSIRKALADNLSKRQEKHNEINLKKSHLSEIILQWEACANFSGRIDHKELHRLHSQLIAYEEQCERLKNQIMIDKDDLLALDEAASLLEKKLLKLLSSQEKIKYILNEH